MNDKDLGLLHRHLDGTITAEEFPRLQQVLRESAEARRMLRDLAAIDAKLTEIAAGDASTLQLLGVPPPPPPRRLVFHERWMAWLTGHTLAPLAAGLALGVFCTMAVLGYSAVSHQRETARREEPVRAAVIGTLTNLGLWDAIATRFEKATGRKVRLAFTGDREFCEDAFRKGRADLVVMHSGDDAAKLLSEGYGVNLHPWAYNELVIAGPPSDPAGIQGMTNGAEALRRIADTHSPYYAFQGSGSADIARELWWSVGIVNPEGSWVLKDDEDRDKSSSLRFAEMQGAYVITGRLQMHSRKVKSGKMIICVQGDPSMHRPIVYLEANPKRFPKTNIQGAHALADFLISPEIQKLVGNFGAEEHGVPYFLPVQRKLATR